MEDVHHGAVTILAYWHYFKRCDLMDFNWNHIDDSAPMSLEPHQARFMQRIIGRVKQKCTWPAADAAVRKESDVKGY